MAGLLPRVKPVAMAFLPYSLLLGTLNANSVLYLHRNPNAKATFGGTALKVLLIGELTLTSPQTHSSPYVNFMSNPQRMMIAFIQH